MKLKKETMSKHFIYHIFGKKVGVTNNVVRRMKEQGIKEEEYEIIEEHTNAKTASVRERELQIEKGYPVDKIPYYKTLKAAKKCHTPEANAKRVANTDYKIVSAKRSISMDYKAMAAKIDYKASRAKVNWKAVHTKRTANFDYKAKAEKCKKPIIQYDLKNKFIKTWPSAKEAAEKLNIHKNNIGACCRGEQKSAYGYVWKYAN